MYTVTISRLGQEQERFNHTTLEDAQARFRSLTWGLVPPIPTPNGGIVAIGLLEGERIRELWYTPDTDAIIRHLTQV